MDNNQRALLIRQLLIDRGLRAVVLCAGARNIPLIDVFLRVNGLPIYHFYDERAASFFAMGLAQDLQGPVAVVTTSGTAVSECSSAVIEAFYQKLPLVVLSADRPKIHRGRGTPQSLEQVAIFGRHVHQMIDIADSVPELPAKIHGPWHINVCLDEPGSSDPQKYPWVQARLIDDATYPIQSSSTEQPMVFDYRRPLIVAGPMHPSEAQKTLSWLQNYSGFIYSEKLANLPLLPEPSRQILDADAFFRAFRKKQIQPPDVIIRLGGVPTGRFWRDLEQDFSAIPVHTFSHVGWPGLVRQVHTYPHRNLLFSGCESAEDWVEWNQKQKDRLRSLLHKLPTSEAGGLFHFLDRWHGRLYFGNSLPVRTGQLVTQLLPGVTEAWAHRGVNGIDGQGSGFIGWMAHHSAQGLAVLGDLTALYDLNSLHLLGSGSKINRRLGVLVVNNGGGQIFKKFSREPAFIHPHEINFEPWAKMFAWDYQLCNSERQSSDLILQRPTVFELRPEPEASEEFEHEWHKV